MTRRLACAAVVLGLLLGACADDESPRPSPSSSASAASSAPADGAFPPESVLDVPEPERPTVPEGPTTVAFAREYADYLLDAMAYAMQTSFIPADLRDSTCGFCRLFVQASEGATEAGYLFAPPTFEVLSATPRPDLPLPIEGIEDGQTLDLVIRVSDVAFVDVTGEVVETRPTITYDTRFALQSPRLDKSWLILDDRRG